MPEYKVNFVKIKEEFPILKVCDRLGLKLNRQKTSQHRGKCPFCEDDRSFVVTPEKNMYGCWTCKARTPDDYCGDQLKLIMKVNGLADAKAAAEWLTGKAVGGTVKAQPQSASGFVERDYLQHDHPDVEMLGFTSEDAERIGIGYAPKGSMKGNVMVPIRLKDGMLIGYIGVFGEIILPEEWHFPKSNVVPLKTG